MSRRSCLLSWLLLGLAMGPASRADVVVTDSAGVKVTTYSASHALVIGVSDYTAGWSDLPNIPSEMKQVEEALEAQGFSVQTVLNPTRDRLLAAVDQFINAHGYIEGNRLLFFFAGHGHSRTVYGSQRGFLIPADAPLPTPAAMRQFLEKAVSMIEVGAWARKIEARHVLFVFDSCFSGTVFDTRAGLPEPAHITTLTGQPVRQFLTAGSAGETVPARSFFTPAFVRALSGTGDLTRDGYVTGTELGVYLHQEVAGSGQTPQHGRLLGYHEGDFVFRLPFEPPPATVTFDLTDLESQVERESSWAAYQRDMDAAFEKVESLAASAGTVETKQVAWQRFLQSFAQDNPLSTSDEVLRRKAQAEVDRWGNPQRGLSAGDFEDALGMRFRYIPAGTFTMGSPESEPGRDSDETQHKVTLTRSFWMAETEVTQAQWRELMGNNPSRQPQCGQDCPVEMVNWYEALTFTNELSRKAGLEVCYRFSGGNGKKAGEGLEYENVQFEGLGCKGFRLPTEAEWEYAARAGAKGAIYTAKLTMDEKDLGKELNDIAWWSGNSGLRTHPVGQKAANEWGLRDMLGNVREWVWDGWENEPATVVDPQGMQRAEVQVVRGGSWGDAYPRLAHRVGEEPSTRYLILGFRVVRTVP